MDEVSKVDAPLTSVSLAGCSLGNCCHTISLTAHNSDAPEHSVTPCRLGAAGLRTAICRLSRLCFWICLLAGRVVRLSCSCHLKYTITTGLKPEALRNKRLCENVSLTRNTGNAEDVRVAHQETFQDVSGLVGVDDDRFGGGLGAGADPHQRGQLVLLPMLLLLVLRAVEATGG